MPLEQIPLFEESKGPGKSVLIETAEEKAARLAAESRMAFAHIQEVVKNAPSWEELKKNGAIDDGRSRHTRKLRGANEKEDVADDVADSWIRAHEARQDERAEQFGPEADRPDTN